MRHVEMARKSERPKDFVGNIILVKAEKTSVCPLYLILLTILFLSIALFMTLHRRKRKYSGFKYRKTLIRQRAKLLKY
jgi:hypothetical protein